MKYYILLLGLFLFGCTDDNISLQTSVTVNVSKAGTLDSLLNKYRKEVIDTLVVTGKINEIDLITIKYMSNLSYIDLQSTDVQGSVDTYTYQLKDYETMCEDKPITVPKFELVKADITDRNGHRVYQRKKDKLERLSNIR